jgi:hypothetical protein
MTVLPPSPFINSAAQTPADAGASIALSPLSDAPANQPAADHSDAAQPAGSELKAEPAPFYVSPPEFSDISDVHEIFYHARKLIENRFVLNEALFMEALEEPPLFLRRYAR